MAPALLLIYGDHLPQVICIITSYMGSVSDPFMGRSGTPFMGHLGDP